MGKNVTKSQNKPTPPPTEILFELARIKDGDQDSNEKFTIDGYSPYAELCRFYVKIDD